MKRHSFYLVCSLSLLFIINSAIGQTPLWKFYLAFEDSIGAVDTVWFVIDPTATSGLDSQFGETAMSMPTDTFQVYFEQWPDSTKTFALDTIYRAIAHDIEAINVTYPVKMSWDTSLLTNTNLPWEWVIAKMENIYQLQLDFFFQDSVILIMTFNVPHFPMFIDIEGEAIGISESNPRPSMVVYPNPFVNHISIRNELFQEINRVVVWSVHGALIKEVIVTSKNSLKIDMSFLPTGLYYLSIYTKSGTTHEKISKL